MKKSLLFFAITSFVITSCTKKPSACFSADKTEAGTNENINFNSSCSENAESYAWNFGDGSNGEGSSVSHKYTDAGDYTVTLTAKGKKDEAQTTKAIKITGASPNDPLCVQNNTGTVRVSNSYDSNYTVEMNGQNVGQVGGYGTTSAFTYPAGTSISVTITQIDGYILYPSVFTGYGTVIQCQEITIIPN
jgi:PKD repeat protein